MKVSQKIAIVIKNMYL